MQSIGIGLVYFTRIIFVSCIRMAHTPLNILHPLNQTSIFHSCILNQTKPILLFFISYRKPCSGRADHYSFQRRCPTLVHTRGRRPVTPARAWCWWPRCRWWASTAKPKKRGPPSADARTSTSRAPTRSKRCLWQRRCCVWAVDWLCMLVWFGLLYKIGFYKLYPYGTYTLSTYITLSNQLPNLIFVK